MPQQLQEAIAVSKRQLSAAFLQLAVPSVHSSGAEVMLDCASTPCMACRSMCWPVQLNIPLAAFIRAHAEGLRGCTPSLPLAAGRCMYAHAHAGAAAPHEMELVAAASPGSLLHPACALACSRARHKALKDGLLYAQAQLAEQHQQEMQQLEAKLSKQVGGGALHMTMQWRPQCT